MATATIRELRNQFPRVKKLLDAEGEVIVTDKGVPRYRIIVYTPPAAMPPRLKDYLARLRYQPCAMSARQAEVLHEENRGDR